MKLYHYTKFDTFIDDILPKMQLKFFPFASSNDQFEFSRLFRIDVSEFSIRYGKEIAEVYFRQMNKYKFICFSKDKGKNPGFKLPTMWAHYGEKHNGVCLEIESDKLDFSTFKKSSIIKGPVRYYVPDSEKVVLGDQKEDENDKEFIERSINEHIKKWESINLFTKVKDWSIENEYRIVYKNDDNDEHYLEINNALTNVYLGTRASQNWSDSVRLGILEHQINEKNEQINGEIKIYYLDNEGHVINSKDPVSSRFIRENNGAASAKMEQRLQGKLSTPPSDPPPSVKE